MPIQITIIGLGQIGGSIGLALAEHKQLVTRVGHDKSMDIARQAEKAGAVDKIVANLPASVRGADLVVLALPIDQVRETLEFIAQDLHAGAVVVDTAPVKQVVTAWAKELLPTGCHYVGLTPVINPVYLHSVESGPGAARPDLFHDGLIGITTAPGTASEAIKLATDLTKLLGSNPFFADIVEMDSLMAATHLAPQLLGVALINATINQPGWREARKVAGRAYAEATGAYAHMSDLNALGAAALLNKDNVLRVLDNILAGLQNLREMIEQHEGAQLDRELEQARQGRIQWWTQRKAANWLAEEIAPGIEVPTSGEVMGRLIGLGRKPKPKK